MSDLSEFIAEKSHVLPSAIIAFFLIFMIHELGHYIAARLFGMKVEQFSVGLGRKLWGWQDRHGTKWTFHLLPLGGHVLISSLTLSKDEQVTRPVWQRILVVFAGPLSNLLLPFAVLILCFGLVGLPMRPPIISAVEIGTPADQAGLQRGDQILAVNDQNILRYEELGDAILGSKGKTISLTIRRDGEVLSLPVTPERQTFTDVSGIERDKFRIGILNSSTPVPLEFVEEINGRSVEDDPDQARQLLQKTTGQPIKLGMTGPDDKIRTYRLHMEEGLNPQWQDPDHKDYDEIFIGPHRTNRFTDISWGQAFHQGSQEALTLLEFIINVPFQIFPIDPLLYAERIPFTGEKYFTENLIYRICHTTALLSIVIAFINLLPFPRLDGDYILYYLMEAVMKQRPTTRQRATAIMIGLFSIYCVLLFSNLHDLPGYLERKVEDLSEKFEE